MNIIGNRIKPETADNIYKIIRQQNLNIYYTGNIYEIINQIFSHTDFRQMNFDTKIAVISYHKVTLEEINNLKLYPYYKLRLVPIREWSYKGFIALLWRIWKAIMGEGVPDYGYKRVSYISPESTELQTRKIEVKRYAFSFAYDYTSTYQSIYLSMVYDAPTDTLYIYDN